MPNLSGNRWPGRLIRFGFPDQGFDWRGDLRADGYEKPFTSRWEPAPARVVDAHRLIFATIGDQIGLRFEEVEPEDAQIRVALSGVVREPGWAFGPGKLQHRSGAIFHPAGLADAGWEPGSRPFAQGLRLAGRAMGLLDVEGALNTIDISVMATDWPGREEYPERLLPFDIGCLKAAYRREDK